MDLTQGTLEEKHSRAKKMMLWFGIISLVMSFAGWTSAFVVCSSRPDCLHDFELPSAFIASTIVIVRSRITFIFGKRAFKKNQRHQTTVLLFVTLILGIVFIVCQFQGFQQIIDLGY